MSKKQYKEVFSNIHPSDESIERIMSMTNKKHICALPKAMIILAIIISLFCSVGLVANAATDGAVAETISDAAKEASRKITVLVNGKEEDEKEFSRKIKVSVNGQETEGEVIVTPVTAPDGEEIYEIRTEHVSGDITCVENYYTAVHTAAIEILEEELGFELNYENSSNAAEKGIVQQENETVKAE